ncbi:hypothetical protein HGRIS_014475 [Hohenbuehelia grisea]|uniref:PH domain-containing protein n=1 Tax=Hohenbuehelia grisea TaxID=104357 RepID=A0ABR3JUJ6_9AGAR
MASPTTTPTTNIEPLQQVKLLAALRSGDPGLIHPFIAELTKDKHPTNENNGIDTAAAALHLAIRCASKDTVALLLAHRAINPNGVHPPQSGTTPIHLAASLGRVDIVKLLLDQSEIDDTHLDAQGRNCRDVAKGRDVVRAIDESRAFLNASFRSLLHSYILSQVADPAASTPSLTTPTAAQNSSPGTQLTSLLSSPRARTPYLAVNVLDDASGLTLLHAAAARHDTRMIELAVRAGADIFVRDARGRSVEDAVDVASAAARRASKSGKSANSVGQTTVGRVAAKEWKSEGERVKGFLRQLANHDTTLLDSQSYLSPTTPTIPASRFSAQYAALPSLPTGLESTASLVSRQPSAAATPEAPSLSGYLNKYTNVAKGYNTRWFVIKDGVLSYYRHQDDENIASRGSISMKSAILKVSPGNDRSRVRFEVHTTHSHVPGTHHGQHSSSAAQKWYMKASHPVEAARWVQALSRSIEWWRARERELGAGGGPGGFQRSSTSLSLSSALGASGNRSESEHSSFVDAGSGLAVSTSTSGSGRSSLKASLAGKSRNGDSDTIASGAGDTDAEGKDELHSLNPRNSLAGEEHFDGDEDDKSDEDDEEDDDGGADDSSSGHSGGGIPYKDTFELQGNSLTAQMELVLAALAEASQPQGTRSAADSATISTTLASLTSLQSMLAEHTAMTTAREEWFAKALRRERKRQRVWEESLKVVVKEGEVLEGELRKRARGRRESRFSGVGSEGGGTVGAAGGTVKMRRASRLFDAAGARPESATGTLTGKRRTSAFAIKDDPYAAGGTVQSPTDESQTTPVATARSPLISASNTLEKRPLDVSPKAPPSAINIAAAQTGSAVDDAFDSDADTDEEDEFFDAIESGTLPNLIVPEQLASPTAAHHRLPTNLDQGSELTLATDSDTVHGDDERPGTAKTLSAGVKGAAGFVLDANQYKGYTTLRSRLTMDSDTRPSTSLWSVLKHSIGKDLTKISFPVFFNEPTSMLQRMAEDMEFSECLDVAAQEADPQRRIAFVAAFAMSNYSSTIGRIAKPFNPMLSETFEYVHLDKQYRYVSEQVSHHPPISACWAESPLWHYYGEVDAQNKFMGKSFEIRPTGVAHADLLLPEDLVPDYPKAKGTEGAGKAIEHYSWKKVTTNVSGFLLGSPTIDHYGDMVVVNHRTGDECTLTFKPRGWRGKDAYEISGVVRAANGEVVYEIAGRWNGQLIMRKAGMGSELLHPDISVAAQTQEYTLLWRNTDKPSAPFNLTPFALTLNDCPKDTLRPYLCPTDCRLRPDQRAFELGYYERANDLKNAQEEKQRATRKAREEGRLPAHRPRWFMAETDGDTGERVWTPSRVGDVLEYWVEREKVWREQGQIRWKDVDDIFIQEPDL